MIDQHSSLSEKFLKKGFWLYLFSFIIAPMGYIIKIIVSGEISVEELGILYGIISLITLLSSFNDFGMTESMNHFIPKFITEKRYDKVKSILFFAFCMQISTGLLVAGIFFFGSSVIAEQYFKSEQAISILQTFSLFFLGINIFQILSIFFIAIQNTFLNKLSEFIRMLTTVIFTISVLFLGIGTLEIYAVGWIVGLYTGIIFILSCFYKKYYKKYLQTERVLFDKKLFGEIFRYALLVFLGAQAATILSQIDMQMIILLLGSESAGYYTNYLSIIGIPFILIGPIFLFLFPVVSELISKNDIGKIRTIKNHISLNIANIGLVLSILFFVFAEVITTVLFGTKFVTSGEILQFSILLITFNLLLQVNFNIMAGIGKVKQRVYIISAAIILNIIMNFFLISYIGVYGAALATGIGWIFIWVLSEFTLGNEYKTSFNFLKFGKNFIVFTTLGTLSYIYVIPYINLGLRLQNIGIMSLIGIIWMGIYVFLNRSDFSTIISEIKKIRTKK